MECARDTYQKGKHAPRVFTARDGNTDSVVLLYELEALIGAADVAQSFLRYTWRVRAGPLAFQL